ncbi:MAG: D-glycero-beta-D-manno-heptose 1,7-bisphosphate 7-phosphatase [Burkholderiales bacterium]
MILDRDGVINKESDSFIKSPDEWIPIPRSLEAIARANAAGYRVVVLSNQSAIARGIIDVRTLHLINQKMIQRLAEVGGRIEAIFFCPHAAVQNCLCRKPQPGLFMDLAARLHVSIKNAPAVGDRLRDLEAARAAGARRIEIASDPNAIGFYRKLGARRVGDVPSKPRGRRLPLLRLSLR